jgi:hypothetical protein
MVVLLSHVLSGLITSHVNRDHYKNGLCQIIDEFQFDFDETDPTMDYVIGNFVYQEKNVKTFEYAITWDSKTEDDWHNQLQAGTYNFKFSIENLADSIIKE